MRASRSPSRVITRKYFCVARTRESVGARSMSSLHRALLHPSRRTPTCTSVSTLPSSKASRACRLSTPGVSPRRSAGGGVPAGRRAVSHWWRSWACCRVVHAISAGIDALVPR